MAKIDRKLQKIFAGSASNNGVFGSAQAGTKTLSNDVETIQSLAAYPAGWVNAVIGAQNLPPLEEFQALQYMMTYQLAYLFQVGIAEYDANTTYYTGSFCQVNGAIYRSIADDNIGLNPVSSPLAWTIFSGEQVGVVKDFAGNVASIPSGYLLCDGSAISRTDYADLFAVIGTIWGAGDNSTTFNLPPAGIVTAGYKSGDSDFGTIGTTGGAKTVTLTGAQSGVPVHGHPFRLSLDSGRDTDPTGGIMINADGTISNFSAFTGTPSSTAGQQIGGNTAANAAEAHTNLQPFGVFAKIIKY